MAIVSSTIIEDAPQIDGRRHVRERHEDHVGAMHFFAYTVGAEVDAEAIMLARVPTILETLKAGEIARNLANALSDDTPSPSFLYSTKLEFGAVLRETYKDSRGRDALRLGWYVNQFGLTDNQIKALFSVTDQQLPNVKAKLASLSAGYEAMLEEAGE